MPSTCEATVFYDDVGEVSARLYALAAPQIDGRYLTVDELANCRLDCRVEGPTCRYSTTLKSRTTLSHRGVTTWGDIAAVMAEAFLPDPCPWSPELPFLYRLTGTVKFGDVTIAEIDQPFGIRPLSVARTRLKFQEKTWVPRGVARLWTSGIPLDAWRESATMMVVEDPPDSLLADAGEVGVFVCVHVSGDNVRRTARYFSRFPAVAFIAPQSDVDASLIAAARNTLYLSEFRTAATSRAQLFYCETEWPAGPWTWPQEHAAPILALRPTAATSSFSEARSACDALQRDLAGRCDPAGYIV